MATGGNAIRGTRVGAGPMGEQDHGFHADRVAVSYWDALGNETVRSFAANLPEEEIPETGATFTAAPGEELEVEITLNDGYSIGEWLDGVVLRFKGVQSGSNNVKPSGNDYEITLPAESWLNPTDENDEYWDHELILVIPTVGKPEPIEVTLTVGDIVCGDGFKAGYEEEEGFVFDPEPDVTASSDDVSIGWLY